jgi:hypothetical protein
MQQPLVQVLPPQQGLPGVPQVRQIELLQIVLASVHLLLAQHGPPAAPQSLHVLVLLSQTAPVSLQVVVLPVEVLQQASPRAPQVLHA